MAAGSRRRARVAALQSLYEADSSHHAPLDALKRIAAEERLPKDATAFARNLIQGVLAQQDEIDGIIGKAAPAFPVAQLAPVDRNVLRLAIYEMLGDNGTPIRVVINEAVELAKRFGSDKSPKFVNGVLGTVERQRRKALDQSPAGRG
jgi:N utilization substance protein B